MDDKFKFDVVIGNPPYQEETLNINDRLESKKNGQKPRKNIFQKFQESADKIAREEISLIYPGGRWIHQSGKGLRVFGKKQINDPHLKSIVFFPNSYEVFPQIDIPDGISIVNKTMNTSHDKFKFEYINLKEFEDKNVYVDHPGDKLIPLNPDFIEISNKISYIVKKYNFKYLSSSVSSRSIFGIESDFIDGNDSVEKYKGKSFNTSNKVKLLVNDKSGSAGRAKWFLIDKKFIPKNSELISKYKVVVSSAHPGGQSNRDNKLQILDNTSAFGRSRIALKFFNYRHDAENFYNYMSSTFIKFTLLLTDESLTSFAKWVPDILDYHNDKIIDFSNNIDEQLYNLFHLDSKEIGIINSYVEKSSLRGEIK